MTADIAKSGSAEEGVAHGMQQDVGVAVAEQSFFKRHVDAAEDELAALHEAVDVVSHAKSRHIFVLPSMACAFKNASAMMRSPGVVTLMFS